MTTRTPKMMQSTMSRAERAMTLPHPWFHEERRLWARRRPSRLRVRTRSHVTSVPGCHAGGRSDATAWVDEGRNAGGRRGGTRHRRRARSGCGGALTRRPFALLLVRLSRGGHHAVVVST
ncbi:hypothetical protein MTO96_033180 [Rhipicephalus appendiculatus]